MITSKKELKDYLEKDKWALNLSHKKRPNIIRDEIWIYEICLRKREYYTYISAKYPSNIFYRVMKVLYTYLHFRKGVKLGYSIPINVFGPGLSIQHIGPIVVNPNAKIGSFCRIHECTTIGATNGNSESALIGDYCFIATGAKIIGNVTIGNRVSIGANAVVTKSIVDGVTVGGVPAKIISEKGSYSMIKEWK